MTLHLILVCMSLVAALQLSAAELTVPDLLSGDGSIPGDGIGVADEQVNLLADIRLHSSDELYEILKRVEQLLERGEKRPGTEAPVVFLLHGDEGRVLLQPNYASNKSLVDLAARLSAFGVVDIKVCETWMGNHQLDKSQLQPFVETVPYAPDEEKRMLEELGYHYF